MSYILTGALLLLVVTINYCDSSSLRKREVELPEELYKNDGLLTTVEQLVGQVTHLLESSLGDLLKVINGLLAQIEGLLVGNNQLSDVEKNTLNELKAALKNIDSIVKKEQENRSANSSHY